MLTEQKPKVLFSANDATANLASELKLEKGDYPIPLLNARERDAVDSGTRPISFCKWSPSLKDEAHWVKRAWPSCRSSTIVLEH